MQYNHFSVITIAGGTCQTYLSARTILLSIIYSFHLIWGEVSYIVRFKWQCSPCCLWVWPQFILPFYISSQTFTYFSPTRFFKGGRAFLVRAFAGDSGLGLASNERPDVSEQEKRKKLNLDPVVCHKLDDIMHTGCSITNHLRMEIWHTFAEHWAAVMWGLPSVWCVSFSISG